MFEFFIIFFWFSYIYIYIFFWAPNIGPATAAPAAPAPTALFWVLRHDTLYVSVMVMTLYTEIMA